MKIKDFEKAVWELETIRIVIRDDWNEEVTCYPWVKAACGSTSLKEFIQTQITGRVNGEASS